MNPNRFTFLVTLIGSVLAVSSTALAQTTYSFKPLTMVPTYASMGTVSRAVGVSPDGAFAGGEHQGQAALEKNGSLIPLGFLPGSSFSQATAVAANGDAAAGWTGLEAFHWSPGTGIQGLGVLPGYQYSLATDISEKGETVLGYCTNGQYSHEAFLWSASTGMQGLGVLPGDYRSFGTALSGGGDIATGYSSGASGATAFRWESGQLISLGVPTGYTSSSGLGISRYGDFIVGRIQSVNGIGEGFVWDKSSNAMKGIGAVPGMISSYLRDVSEDGIRSVGSASSTSGSFAILYDAQLGKSRILQDYLLSKGVTSVRGWQLQEATSISDDGTVIVGIGTNPRGRRMCWQITIP